MVPWVSTRVTPADRTRIAARSKRIDVRRFREGVSGATHHARIVLVGEDDDEIARFHAKAPVYGWLVTPAFLTISRHLTASLPR